ncbi:cytochrome ubiquinol oxidase subunit I [Rubrimonas cliftonensis]|uniref:Cytochrome bd-I ubiquinol oxidase subunit 1 apoprotein n=1 Tax=Rubrimonas cliftonensis TaxID=89524 RepID=A0A1H4A3J9_9RHOB|nr:cytochrome ubiquinol oxidase subunit I [Rubrimonas cliftonensis]SEA30450.1 cytochrome bd-I ubiquinol oxidase subunit 1 apoprotein [Rubrimonas cliftonensis]
MGFGYEALDLARFQFAFTVSAHIIFPAFSIGLASYLAVLNGLGLATGDAVYRRLFDYWKTIFAVVFGMGVVSGIVMSYQFGTNWSVFSDKTGPVLGPLMGYEVLSAFFLEAGFLGVMLFGRERVGPNLHFFATLMVAVGTLFSAFWILSVNSWMHTPAGYGVNEVGQFVPVDWWAVVFNPSFPYRLVHMVLAAYLTTAFIVGGVGAWHLLRARRTGRTDRAARVMFSMAMWMALLVAPLQIVAGDLHGINTLEHQPAKIAAMEGHYETRAPAPLILFGLPDDEAEETRHAVEIPYLGSLILKHDLSSPVQGLKEFPKEERPPAALIFWTFRVMVAVGFAMLAVGLWSGWARLKGRLFELPWLHRAAVAMGPSGFLAVLCGWITTEVGRQPYTVYGLLRTADSASPLDAPAVGASLLAFIIVYFAVFGAGTFYVLRLMAHGPEDGLDIDALGPTRAAGVTPAASMRRPAAHPAE